MRQLCAAKNCLTQCSPIPRSCLQRSCELFYVNDNLESNQTIDKARKKAQELVHFLRLCEFRLTKFVKNVPEVVADLNRNTGNKHERVIAGDNETQHVLRLKWNHQSDNLVVSRGIGPEPKDLTKQRTVLTLVSTVFNLICLVAPYTVKACLLLKDSWRLSSRR